MTQISNYCKAYLARELRQFHGWSEQVPPLAIPAEKTESMEDEIEYFFLHDNFIVTAGVYCDENVVFDQVTPDWKEFCKTILNFDSPAAGASLSF
jgi:hypothetical protein